MQIHAGCPPAFDHAADLTVDAEKWMTVRILAGSGDTAAKQ